MSDPWMTGHQLAEELGLTLPEVRTMRARGRGPAGRRFGKEVKYHRDVVDAWKRGRS